MAQRRPLFSTTDKKLVSLRHRKNQPIKKKYMENQIKIMEEMVQRTEANLQQMQALLAEAKANQVSSMTLNDELIRRIAEELASNFRSDMYLTDMVEMDTSVCGMDITVDLSWEYSVDGSIKDWAYQIMANLRDELL